MHFSCLVAFKTAMLNAAGPTMQKKLRDRESKIVMHNIATIYSLILAEYDVYTPQRIQFLTNALCLPLLNTDMQIFKAHGERFLDNVGYLMEAGQPPPPATLFHQFCISCESQPPAHEAVRDFKKLHPRVVEQLHEPLIAYVTEQLQQTTTSASGYANSAVAPPWEAPLAAMVTMMAAMEARLSTSNISSANAAVNISRKSKKVGGTASGHTPAAVPAYCYKCGYKEGGHWGSLPCPIMTRIGGFTPAQFSATRHDAVTGGNAKVWH